MTPDWEAIIRELETEFDSLDGEMMRAMELKQRTGNALALAESGADSGVISRLDSLFMRLTEAAKENVCTNTKCPHYYKKCRMR